jgi:Tfp pilus assembly protein PilX
MTSGRTSHILPPRRGGMLIIVLVCLIVAATILASVLKLAGSYRRDQAAEQNRAQADWLAESALERAVSRLQKDAAYSGEIWKVGPEELQRQQAGEVTIRVESDRQMPEARRIVIVAEFPADSATPARRTKEQTVSMPTPKPQAPDTTE